MIRSALHLVSLTLLGLGLPAVAVPAAAASYQIDAVHSSVLFKVKHFGVANVYGRFNEIAGTIEYDDAAPESGKVELVIQAGSVDTHAEDRDNHLRSPDFFNAAQFPTITFESTKVEKAGDDTYRVTGDLTLLGVTKPVTLTVEKTGEGAHPRSQKPLIGFEARGTIRRSEWGMEFMNGPLSDEVELIIAIEAGGA
ncbi:MAG TPA: YceI family protein [Thermoanaerobaculia bacterium]|nr:YceI family protein [Thermoanaerobaculia bacterium]